MAAKRTMRVFLDFILMIAAGQASIFALRGICSDTLAFFIGAGLYAVMGFIRDIYKRGK